MSTLEPKTRTEQFYDAILSGDTSELPTPATREEVYLRQIAENGSGGGSSLPEVTVEDNGKVLSVVDGEWDKADASGGGSSLPEVTVEDNGKVLSVVDGEWDKADASSGGVEVVVYKLTNSNLPVLPDGVTHEQIVEEIDDGKVVLLKYKNRYFLPASRKVGSNRQDFASTNVDSRAQYGVRVNVLYLIADSSEDDNSFTYMATNNPELPTAGNNIGKILSVINQGTYGLIDPPLSLPSVTSADNDKILKVVNGEWKAVSPE